MLVDARITVVCESVQRGCEYRALFYDARTEQFYGGSGPTAFEAIAWCMDEYIRRGLRGGGIEPARNPSARPGEGLERNVASAPLPPPLPPPPASPRPTAPLEDAPSSKDEVGCFDRKIPRRAELALHGQAPRYASAGRRR